MSDITQCTNNLCKKRLSCYRFIAPTNEHWQSYGEFNHEGCEYFIEAHNKDMQQYLTRRLEQKLKKYKDKEPSAKLKRDIQRDIDFMLAEFFNTYPQFSVMVEQNALNPNTIDINVDIKPLIKMVDVKFKVE